MILPIIVEFLFCLNTLLHSVVVKICHAGFQFECRLVFLFMMLALCCMDIKHCLLGCKVDRIFGCYLVLLVEDLLLKRSGAFLLYIVEPLCNWTRLMLLLLMLLTLLLWNVLTHNISWHTTSPAAIIIAFSSIWYKYFLIIFTYTKVVQFPIFKVNSNNQVIHTACDKTHCEFNFINFLWDYTLHVELSTDMMKWSLVYHQTFHDLIMRLYPAW